MLTTVSNNVINALVQCTEMLTGPPYSNVLNQMQGPKSPKKQRFWDDLCIWAFIQANCRLFTMS